MQDGPHLVTLHHHIIALSSIIIIQHHHDHHLDQGVPRLGEQGVDVEVCAGVGARHQAPLVVSQDLKQGGIMSVCLMINSQNFCDSRSS